MSAQIRYGITFGSGEKGLQMENLLRSAALHEKLPFSVWIKQTLLARADNILKTRPAEKNKA